METVELTAIEKKVLTLLVRGSDTKQIATELHMSKSYAYQILRQLKWRFGAKTSARVAVYALSKGVIPAEFTSGVNSSPTKRADDTNLDTDGLASPSNLA